MYYMYYNVGNITAIDDLNNKLIEQGFLKVQANPINHWGIYLWQMTARPSKRDYQNLAISIVQA